MAYKKGDQEKYVIWRQGVGGTQVFQKGKGGRRANRIEGQTIGFGDEVIVGDHSRMEGLRHDPDFSDCR